MLINMRFRSLANIIGYNLAPLSHKCALSCYMTGDSPSSYGKTR